MENSISALPKWHWKFIASVLLFRNCSGKHRRWKQLVQVYTVRQRIKTQGCSTQTVYRSPSLAATTKRIRPQSSKVLEPEVFFLALCRIVSARNSQSQVLVW